MVNFNKFQKHTIINHGKKCKCGAEFPIAKYVCPICGHKLIS